MNMKNAWWLVSTLALGCGLAGYAAGCGGDESGGGGSAGSTSASTTTSTGTSMVSTSATMQVDNGDWIGDICTTPADCAAPNGVDKICVASTDNDPVFGGGPSGGYCTRKCSKGSDCPGSGTVCYKGLDGSAAEGRCVLGCTLGPELGSPDFPSLQTPLDLSKCHGRDDIYCRQINMVDMCLPACGGDTRCDGAFCDTFTGSCVATQPTEKPLGGVCDPMAMVPECQGLCVTGGTGPGFCSQYCTFGGDILDDCGGIDKGACLLTPAQPKGIGLGDAAFCAPACKEHSDCVAPSLFCYDFGAPDNGFCVPGLPDCMTQADCDSEIAMKNIPMGYKCTATSVGSFCLDPKYPLGALTPTADGGTDGGGGMGGAGGAGGAGGGMDAGVDSGDGG